MRSRKKRWPSSGLGRAGSTAFGSIPAGAVGHTGFVSATHSAQCSGYSPSGGAGMLAGGSRSAGSTSGPGA